jgi:hypothetical protein
MSGSKPRRSLRGPWGKLSNQSRKTSAVPKSSEPKSSKPIIVDSVECWEDLHSNNIFLALPQNKEPLEEVGEGDKKEEEWDNESVVRTHLHPPTTSNKRVLNVPPSSPQQLEENMNLAAELKQFQMLSSSRPMLLINAKVARADNSGKSLSQTALAEIQSQLQEALASDFENRVEQLFRSGLCFHTDTSEGGRRLERDRTVLQSLYPGEKFVSIEYPSEYVGSGKNEVAEENTNENKALLWENVTRTSSSRAITMMTSCIRECHQTMEWKSAMRSEIDRLGQKQIGIIEKRTIKEMELIRKCDEASHNLNMATAAVIQYHDGFVTSIGGNVVVQEEQDVGENMNVNENENGDSCTTLKDAREKVIVSSLASTAAELEFNKFEKRQRRRERRLERRRQEERLKKEAARVEQQQQQAPDPNQHRKMSLIDQIIAVVFDGIPIGQRIPVEVGGESNHITLVNEVGSSSCSNINCMKGMLERHFKCLLSAQLRIRHQWEVDFGFLPLHEYDCGVESGTDSDSDGDAKEKEVELGYQRERKLENGDEEEDDIYTSDSGSDGWRRRGGGMGGSVNWGEDDYDENEEGERYDGETTAHRSGGDSNNTNDTGDRGFHVVSFPSL